MRTSREVMESSSSGNDWMGNGLLMDTNNNNGFEHQNRSRNGFARNEQSSINSPRSTANREYFHDHRDFRQEVPIFNNKRREVRDQGESSIRSHSRNVQSPVKGVFLSSKNIELGSKLKSSVYLNQYQKFREHKTIT